MGRIAVRAQPRARLTEIVGERGGALVVRVTAPPADGRANDAVRRLLAEALRVAPSRVAIVRGAGSRDKLLEIDGLDAQEVRERLGLPPAGTIR